MAFKELADKLGLKEEQFREILKTFISASLSDIDKLQSAYENKDAKLAIEAAHSLKGASGNLGFMDISVIARNAEECARSNNFDGLNDAVALLKEKVDLIRKNL